MTQAELEQWLADAGINPNVISDEAGYVYGKYGPGGESWIDDAALMHVLESSLPSYMQRTLSGGPRDQGGYSTSENDPEITINGYTAPARYDSAGPDSPPARGPAPTYGTGPGVPPPGSNPNAPGGQRPISNNPDFPLPSGPPVRTPLPSPLPGGRNPGGFGDDALGTRSAASYLRSPLASPIPQVSGTQVPVGPAVTTPTREALEQALELKHIRESVNPYEDRYQAYRRAIARGMDIYPQ